MHKTVNLSMMRDICVYSYAANETLVQSSLRIRFPQITTPYKKRWTESALYKTACTEPALSKYLCTEPANSGSVKFRARDVTYIFKIFYALVMPHNSSKICNFMLLLSLMLHRVKFELYIVIAIF